MRNTSNELGWGVVAFGLHHQVSKQAIICEGHRKL